MLITATLLRQHRACEEQVAHFEELYPDGCQPTVETLTELAAEVLDAWWLVRLLPAEGFGSMRAYALWCAEQVAHLATDPRVATCLAVVRQRVEDPASVSDDELRKAATSASDAASDAARSAAAARYAASYAVDGYANYADIVANAASDADIVACDAASDASYDAQLACLSQMLLEMP